MYAHVDWTSFTVFIGPEVTGPTHELPTLIVDACRQLSPDLPRLLELDDMAIPARGRAPYSHSWRKADGSLTIYAGNTVPHALIEITGRGCQKLIDTKTITPVLEAISPRLTRLDIANDFQTEVRPVDFVAKRQPGRFKSHGEVVSETGETCYVGSRSSDRYARVYRYNPPHERAHLLRIEYVLKAEQAKVIAPMVLKSSVEAVSSGLGEQFGWEHPYWLEKRSEPVDVPAWRPERREGKTLYWLNTQVAPVLRRLAKEQTLDPQEWLKSMVLDELAETRVH